MISIALGDWNVEIDADSQIYENWLSECLANELNGPELRSCARQVSIRIVEAIGEPTASTAGTDGGIEFDIPRLGFARRICFDTNRIDVRVLNEQYALPNFVYHVGLLTPLSYLFRQYGSSLAHAGLLADGKRGTLIVGKSGAGKSSFSLALAYTGNRLFSDEHPILSEGQDGILGSRFLGVPALKRGSAEHLVTGRFGSHWSQWREKFCIDVSELKLAEPGESCLVRRIIFPQYDASTRLELRPLSQLDAFRLLCQDEYLPVSSRHIQEQQRHRAHINMFLSLAGAAESYAVRYNAEGLVDICNGRPLVVLP